MSVRTFATVMLPEMFGIVVDMPTPELFMVQDKNGNVFAMHLEDIREFFYN